MSKSNNQITILKLIFQNILKCRKLMFLSIQTMEILNSQTTYYISNSLTHQEIQNPKFNSVCLNCCLKHLIKVRNHINFYFNQKYKTLFLFFNSFRQ